ncbi:hypothetical protein Salat_2530500 [Sesamum alatum]|uniref:Uncharacterized protein n=1 Tax=Sesamum alatum TaxID=300844 RepID=A0AAE2CCJ4_9LAMI|nr:hypothetical protein Salat_2530500 [Sesamum alatum]
MSRRLRPRARREIKDLKIFVSQPTWADTCKWIRGRQGDEVSEGASNSREPSRQPHQTTEEIKHLLEEAAEKGARVALKVMETMKGEKSRSGEQIPLPQKRQEPVTPPVEPLMKRPEHSSLKDPRIEALRRELNELR